MNSDANKLEQDLARVDGSLEAIAQLQKEIELWFEEEPKGTTREALDNVITLLESEMVEYQKRRKIIIYQLRHIGFFIEI